MRLVSPDVPDAPGELRAVMNVQNEALRLPAVLAHHRALGIGRFLIVDDGSTDGTTDYLLAQSDVSVFQTEGSFADGGGIGWTNSLLDRYGDGRWMLIIDADELFVYPDCERVGLAALTAHLEARGVQGLLALMIDMYGPGDVQDTICEPGQSLITAAPWFDPGPYQAFRTPGFPHLQAAGGPRTRLFDFSPYQPRPPVLTKVPLVRWSRGMRFHLSTQSVTPMALPPHMAGLLHFKFLSDFPERVEAAVAAKQHYGEAQEYRAYQDRLRRDPRLRIRDKESAAYRDTGQLVELSLMHVDADYQAFAQAASTAPQAR
ncbi:MAG: glycosyltransferase family 2 protein [Phenylobacterium sp.]|nr:glycosyltransferase family 2 protein [Phenylobacterium sp.]